MVEDEVDVIKNEVPELKNKNISIDDILLDSPIHCQTIRHIHH